MSKKQVLMVMPVLKGGGAERVASILTNEFYKNGCSCEFLLTSSQRGEVINRDLNENVPILILQEFFSKSFTDVLFKILRVITSLLCKPIEKLGREVPAYISYLSFIANYHREVKACKKVLKERPEASCLQER